MLRELPHPPPSLITLIVYLNGNGNHEKISLIFISQIWMEHGYREISL